MLVRRMPGKGGREISTLRLCVTDEKLGTSKRTVEGQEDYGAYVSSVRPLFASKSR